MAATPAQVVAAARAELGTRWGHQGRLRGKMLDCAGLVIAGVCWPLGLMPTTWDVNGYSRWPDGRMLALLHEHCTPIDEIELGAVICMRTAVHPQHVGIAGDYLHGGYSLIHSTNTMHPRRVVEHRMVFTPALQFVAAFRLPGVLVDG